jgi:hypothetical protein
LNHNSVVIAGLDPAIHDILCRIMVDARVKRGHDGWGDFI